MIYSNVVFFPLKYLYNQWFTELRRQNQLNILVMVAALGGDLRFFLGVDSFLGICAIVFPVLDSAANPKNHYRSISLLKRCTRRNKVLSFVTKYGDSL